MRGEKTVGLVFGATVLLWVFREPIDLGALRVPGWSQLFANQVYIHSDNSAGYLYVISGLHIAHVIAGLPFLAAFFWTARKRMKEPVSVLVYFSDPEKRLKLRLLTIYWHFLDGLWIYLVVFFFINYLIY